MTKTTAQTTLCCFSLVTRVDIVVTGDCSGGLQQDAKVSQCNEALQRIAASAMRRQTPFALRERFKVMTFDLKPAAQRQSQLPHLPTERFHWCPSEAAPRSGRIGFSRVSNVFPCTTRASITTALINISAPASGGEPWELLDGGESAVAER